MDEEAVIAQHDRYLRKGLRTPSSLGSPPLSAAPTEAPTPRQIEAESGTGSAYGSSDDHPSQREPGLEANTVVVSDVQDLPCLDVKAFATTPISHKKAPIVIESDFDTEVLALTEAPHHPTSPAR
jgi:hypothetical protein